jgi:hypothetical protein
MKISEYVKEYTSGHPVKFSRIIDEVKEYWEAFIRFDMLGMNEESQDVLHFLQLWLYWKFRIDGNVWKLTKDSVDKFMARRQVWKRIYKYVGLAEDVSHFCGNYQKQEKVIKHLSEFGIAKGKSVKAYEHIVLKI